MLSCWARGEDMEKGVKGEGGGGGNCDYGKAGGE